MRVSEIMVKQVARARPDETVEAARDRMEASDIRHLPVVDASDRLVGMVSDRDLLRARAFQPPPTRISDIMSKHPQTIAPDASAEAAAQAMLDFKIDALPVVANAMVVGIVTSTDFLSLACKLLRASGSK
jgi:CBS domain-containing protein